MIKQRETKHSQIKKYDYFNYMKKIFHYLLIPLKWFYNLKPIDKFTFALSVVAFIQALAFIQGERAFVYPTTANFTAGPLSLNMPVNRLSIVLKNSGKGTATITEFYAAITHSLAPQPIYPGPEGKFTLPPIPSGVDIEHVLLFNSKWPEATTKAVQDGTMRFYIFGKFKYRDSYSWLFPVNESGFCFEFDHLSSSSEKSVFRNCIEHAYTYTR